VAGPWRRISGRFRGGFDGLGWDLYPFLRRWMGIIIVTRPWLQPTQTSQTWYLDRSDGLLPDVIPCNTGWRNSSGQLTQQASCGPKIASARRDRRGKRPCVLT